MTDGYPRRFAIVLLWLGIGSYLVARGALLIAGVLGCLDP